MARRAMEQVLESLPELPVCTGAKDTDLIFLRGLLESPIVQSLAKAQARLEEPKLEAVGENNLELVKEILEDISPMADQDGGAAELANILNEPHFQSLLEAHDVVASQSYDNITSSTGNDSSDLWSDPAALDGAAGTDAIRMVGIRKVEGQPLGVTFRVESSELVIARILRGGMIDQQGLLHVGDVIREVNGRDVTNDPAGLQRFLREATGSVVLKILPSYTRSSPPAQVFVKCYFDYNPEDDQLIPCKEAGLRFNRGDILQIVSQEDPDWWQALKVKDGGSAGLIPSQTLEEKRKAYVRHEWDYTGVSGGFCGVLGGKKKKKMMYMSTKNAEFDRHEILIYEEVAKMPPFQRKTLMLIGAQGVGRRSLKNRLLVANPSRYGMIVPFTSRPPRDDEKEGQGYYFVSRADMEADIRAGRYLESGEYEGNLYGTKIESIHGVVRTGKMCILDVNPQALKVLRTAEFMPFVVFVAAPTLETLRAMHRAALDAGATSKHLTDTDLKKTVDESVRIQRAYSHFFDLKIVNNNMDVAFAKLRAALEGLGKGPQWVPISWVY
ncbi:protein PALS2-like isoform X2 [Petromyzon marinus]|uniref:MAGUK p55 subfamily member 6-like isoform X2 n=1 Tax=Petromyzon marinus TaxID=7757 RepID=A0AAJ7SYT3_PETMA|nr:MAGUK p55 subfamily member 6-like isoform X2 [Petromyzon marinus]